MNAESRYVKMTWPAHTQGVGSVGRCLAPISARQKVFTAVTPRFLKLYHSYPTIFDERKEVRSSAGITWMAPSGLLGELVERGNET